MTKTETERILGRVFMQMDYGKAIDTLKQFRPMLKAASHVSNIYSEVQEQFLDESPENRRLIFIACVYQIYQPLSFLEGKEDKKAQGKLPAGVRDEMSRCLEFNNPEMTSHFKKFTESWMKPFNSGPERPFRTKVMSIVERFKAYSIHKDDTQFSLAL
ncbi:hypothetical protein [Pedobacter nyackensis]|uniref:Uncharacterized protein n=1 Tax=Pedobacter nyackensis TaxID=475255 RepID=A0A1W1ZW62_9SPHI|nr:hypothetical protein [Pedobacter nyackensis]SMC52660.1 hypothetical protein SAMN04488101_101102 [Pedobacter nyackensis]